MRLVFDTNVLIAAHLTPGHCATLYQEALIAATLLSSDPILTEFEEKLVAKGKVKAGDAARMRAEVAEDCTLVVPAGLAAPVCRDPDDDVILATAIAADADLNCDRRQRLARAQRISTDPNRDTGGVLCASHPKRRVIQIICSFCIRPS